MKNTEIFSFKNTRKSQQISIFYGRNLFSLKKKQNNVEILEESQEVCTFQNKKVICHKFPNHLDQNKRAWTNLKIHFWFNLLNLFEKFVRSLEIFKTFDKHKSLKLYWVTWLLPFCLLPKGWNIQSLYKIKIIYYFQFWQVYYQSKMYIMALCLYLFI